MARRQTVNIKDVLDKHDIASKAPDGFLRLENRDGSPMTPEQAYRMGQNSMVEMILHMTGTYRGFSYNHLERDPENADKWITNDESRRHYMI